MRGVASAGFKTTCKTAKGDGCREATTYATYKLVAEQRLETRLVLRVKHCIHFGHAKLGQGTSEDASHGYHVKKLT